MFTYIICRFLIIETFVMGALGRPCVAEHPQKLLCKSEFALKAKTVGEITAARDQVLRMVIGKVFKGDARKLHLVENGEIIVVISRTRRYDFMSIGQDYIIFGNSDYGLIIVSTLNCNGSMPWVSTSEFVKLSLQANDYKRNCDCYPEVSSDATSDSRQKYCEWSFSYKARSGIKCNWVKTTPFKKCLLRN